MTRPATPRGSKVALAASALILGGVAFLAAPWGAPQIALQPQASVAATATPQARTTAKRNRPAIHLNTATSRELRQLPGVGELLAQRIIAARPYRSVDDLKRVKGVTEERYERIVRVAVP